MMRGSFFDDEGTVHTWGLPGTLLVSMEFDDREEEIAGADGETETVVAHFNKRERFQNVLFGHTLWDMVLNFGYNRRADGTCEVYHNGESFRGPFPIRLLFWLHGKYVIWATKKFINGNLFESEDLLDEKEAEREAKRKRVEAQAQQDAADVEEEPALILGVNEVLQKHPSAFTALEDGDALEIELGGFNGLWMMVLAFKTRGYFPERVIVFADVTVDGKEISSLSLSKQSLEPGGDGWDYYYDLFLIANDTTAGGKEAVVDLTVRDYEGKEFEVSIQKKLLIVGGDPPYWP